VSLSSVCAQSADLKPFFENLAQRGCDRNSCQYLYRMYDRNLSYLYGMYGNLAYDLYVLYDTLSPKKRSASHLNLCG